MIGLAGEILPVGGVAAKVKAVKAYGVGVFLVPVGEAVPIQGLEEHTVADILEAAYYFTGINVTKLLGSPCPPPETLKKIDVFKYHYKRLYNITEHVLEKIESKIDKKTLEQIEKNLELAEEEAKKGNYYSAASYAFTALIQTLAQYYTLKLNNATNVENFVKSEISSLRKYTEIVPQGCGANYWSAEACAAVYNREFRLHEMLKQLETMSANVTAHSKAVAALLARAKARAISITLWADAVKQLAKVPEAPKLRNLERVAKEAYALGFGAAKYAISLAPLSKAVTDQLGDAVDTMTYALYNGNYFKVIGISSYLFETSADVIGSIQNSTVVARKIMPLVVGRSYCTTPSFIAYNYASYVKSLLKTDPIAAEFLAYTAIYYAHLAEVSK
jgi:predicted S18 family serine protease